MLSPAVPLHESNIGRPQSRHPAIPESRNDGDDGDGDDGDEDDGDDDDDDDDDDDGRRRTTSTYG